MMNVLKKINVLKTLYLKTLYIALNFAVALSFQLSASTPSFKEGEIEKLLPPFKASYNILRQGDVVGTAHRTLNYLDDSYVQYQFNSSIEWFIFSDQRHEDSLINISQGKIQPASFNYSRKGTGKDKFYQLRFDIAENKVTDILNDKVISSNLPENSQDQLSHHLALQLTLLKNEQPLKPNQSFSYSVVKASGKLKNYTYSYDGQEDIMLPYGLVQTIKLKQENSSKTKINYVWFAPKLNFQLVKLYQTKKGVEQFETQLTSLKPL